MPLCPRSSGVRNPALLLGARTLCRVVEAGRGCGRGRPAGGFGDADEHLRREGEGADPIERAHAGPSGRAGDPQWGGPAGAEGVTLPATPLEPQPASDRRSAFERYLQDLPEAALGAIVSLYPRRTRLERPPRGGHARERRAAPSRRSTMV